MQNCICIVTLYLNRLKYMYKNISVGFIFIQKCINSYAVLSPVEDKKYNAKSWHYKKGDPCALPRYELQSYGLTQKLPTITLWIWGKGTCKQVNTYDYLLVMGRYFAQKSLSQVNVLFHGKYAFNVHVLDTYLLCSWLYHMQTGEKYN